MAPCNSCIEYCDTTSGSSTGPPVKPKVPVPPPSVLVNEDERLNHSNLKHRLISLIKPGPGSVSNLHPPFGRQENYDRRQRVTRAWALRRNLNGAASARLHRTKRKKTPRLCLNASPEQKTCTGEIGDVAPTQRWPTS